MTNATVREDASASGDRPVAVVDLGSNSLERVKRESLPRTRRHIDGILRRELSGTAPSEGFCVGGGGWRVLARVHLANHRRVPGRHVPTAPAAALALDRPRTVISCASDAEGDACTRR